MNLKRKDWISSLSLVLQRFRSNSPFFFNTLVKGSYVCVCVCMSVCMYVQRDLQAGLQSKVYMPHEISGT